MEHIYTKSEFEALPPYEKGYLVYMRGEWKEQPNIPKKYTPLPDEREAYDKGAAMAVQVAQDDP